MRTLRELIRHFASAFAPCVLHSANHVDGILRTYVCVRARGHAIEQNRERLLKMSIS